MIFLSYLQLKKLFDGNEDARKIRQTVGLKQPHNEGLIAQFEITNFT